MATIPPSEQSLVRLILILPNGLQQARKVDRSMNLFELRTTMNIVQSWSFLDGEAHVQKDSEMAYKIEDFITTGSISVQIKLIDTNPKPPHPNEEEKKDSESEKFIILYENESSGTETKLPTSMTLRDLRTKLKCSETDGFMDNSQRNVISRSDEDAYTVFKFFDASKKIGTIKIMALAEQDKAFGDQNQLDVLSKKKTLVKKLEKELNIEYTIRKTCEIQDGEYHSVLGLSSEDLFFLLLEINYRKAYKIVRNSDDSIYFELAPVHFFAEATILDRNETLVGENKAAYKAEFVETYFSREAYSQGFKETLVKGGYSFVCELEGKRSSAFSTLSKDLAKSYYFHAEYVIKKGKINLEKLNKNNISCDVSNFFRNPKDVTSSRIKQFFDRFGHLVPKTVTLGGKLFSLEKVAENERTDADKKEFESSFQAKARIEGTGLGLGGTNKAQEGQTSQTTCKRKHVALESWGGVPESFGDSSAWLKSLATYPKSWQIVNFGELVPTYEYLPNEIQREFLKVLKLSKKVRGYYVLGVIDNGHPYVYHLSYDSDGNIFLESRNLIAKGEYCDISLGLWGGTTFAVLKKKTTNLMNAVVYHHEIYYAQIRTKLLTPWKQYKHSSKIDEKYCFLNNSQNLSFRTSIEKDYEHKTPILLSSTDLTENPLEHLETKKENLEMLVGPFLSNGGIKKTLANELYYLLPYSSDETKLPHIAVIEQKSQEKKLSSTYNISSSCTTAPPAIGFIRSDDPKEKETLVISLLETTLDQPSDNHIKFAQVSDWWDSLNENYNIKDWVKLPVKGISQITMPDYYSRTPYYEWVLFGVSKGVLNCYYLNTYGKFEKQLLSDIGNVQQISNALCLHNDWLSKFNYCYGLYKNAVNLV